MALALVKMGVYNTYTDQQMLSQSTVIVDTMEKNAPIPEVAALVATVKVSATNYADAYAEAADRSRAAVARKRKAKSDLADNLITLAIGVNYFAAGNKEILALTGLPLEKQKGEMGKKVLGKPTGLTAVNCGNSGCVKVNVKEAPGAGAFVYQWTTEPVTDGSIWNSDGSKQKTFTWKGLKSGTLLWFRVIAIGSGDTRLVSDAVSCMVI